jgi:type I restriction enzyme S subunit
MSAEFNTPFALPDGWGVFSIEALIKDGVLDKPLDGNHGGIHPKASDYVELGVPFIMASDLENGRVDLANCKFISEKQAKTLRKGFSKAGDVLLSHKATIGRTAIVQDSEHEFIVLTPQVTYYRIANKSRINSRYLKSYFDSNFFQSILGQWAGAGSTRAYLGITGQLKLPIILPPLDVQESIAGIVGSLDDKIELNRQINQTLEQIAQTLFKSWFVDFEPVKAKLAALRTLSPDLSQREREIVVERAAMCAISGKREPELDQLPPEQYQQLAATAALFPDALVESELGLIPVG